MEIVLKKILSIRGCLRIINCPTKHNAMYYWRWIQRVSWVQKPENRPLLAKDPVQSLANPFRSQRNKYHIWGVTPADQFDWIFWVRWIRWVRWWGKRKWLMSQVTWKWGHYLRMIFDGLKEARFAKGKSAASIQTTSDNTCDNVPWNKACD